MVKAFEVFGRLSIWLCSMYAFWTIILSDTEFGSNIIHWIIAFITLILSLIWAVILPFYDDKV